MENVYNLKDSAVCIGGEGVYMSNSASSTPDVENMEDTISSVENNAKDCNMEGVHYIKVDTTEGVYNAGDTVCGLSSIKSNASNMNVIYLLKDTVSTTEDIYHVTDTARGTDNVTADIGSLNNTRDNVREDEINLKEYVGDMSKDVEGAVKVDVEDNVLRKEEDPPPLPTLCPLCPTSFIARKNMYVHLRRRHGVEPNTGGKILCPMSCGMAFYRHKDLRTHLEEKHETTIHSEAHDFQDTATFEGWKRGVEQSSGQSWVRRISEKNLKRGEAKTYFICHRSGVHRPKSSPCTRKRPETLKIGTTCPSVMEVSRFPDGSIKVLFFTTHVGHGMESPRTPRRKPKNTPKTAGKKSEMLLWNVCVVLPAAGCGARLGGHTPKQFLPLHNKPIICYTVEAFLRLPYVRRVVVVASSVESMAHTLGSACDLGEESDRLVVTEGAGARHHSIRCGIRALANNDGFEPGVVIVHDGVRPFVSEEVISGVIHAAKTYGAAGVACPLVSTVVSTDADGFLDASLDRSRYRASEMPQAFHYDLIAKAYDMATAYDLEYGTECLHLMQKYLNIKAKLIPGDSNLWKVTYHKDIYTAASVVKENQSVGIINSSAWSSLAAILEKCLSQTFKSVQSAGCRLKEASLRKHPNLVQVCEEADPYPLLERLGALATARIFQRTSLAHIFVNAFDPTLNFLEFQRQAKLCAKLLKDANMLVYFVIYTGATETIEELGEVVRSLLFDSNPSISGSVFLS